MYDTAANVAHTMQTGRKRGSARCLEIWSRQSIADWELIRTNSHGAFWQPMAHIWAASRDPLPCSQHMPKVDESGGTANVDHFRFEYVWNRMQIISQNLVVAENFVRSALYTVAAVQLNRWSVDVWVLWEKKLFFRQHELYASVLRTLHSLSRCALGASVLSPLSTWFHFTHAFLHFFSLIVQ